MEAIDRGMLAAVVFDFDGVLANSEPLHLQAFQAVLAEGDVALSAQEYYERYVGFEDEEVFRRLARDRAVAEDGQEAWIERMLEAKTKCMQELLARTTPLFPGAAGCVRALAARVPVAIASGAARDEILQVLDGAGLTDAFTALVAAGETPHGKPAPDPYRRAVELMAAARGMRLDPRRVVAVEDSHQGLASARAAGLRTAALTTTFRASELTMADAVLPGIAAVTFERLSLLCAPGETV